MAFGIIGLVTPPEYLCIDKGQPGELIYAVNVECSSKLRYPADKMLTCRRGVLRKSIIF